MARMLIVSEAAASAMAIWTVVGTVAAEPDPPIRAAAAPDQPTPDGGTTHCRTYVTEAADKTAATTPSGPPHR